ncbi:MAG TPA: DivIVA domain-containing protein [Nitrospirota bacterium]
MNLSPLDIKQKQFKLKFRGFDMAEVDSFLEEVTEEFEAVIRENEALKEDKASLEAQVSHYRGSEKDLRDTLMSAQKISEEMKLSAEKEARLRLKEAEMDAEKMLREAQHKLGKMQEEISELQRIKERFTLKVKGVIEDHLKMLSYEDQQEGR